MALTLRDRIFAAALLVPLAACAGGEALPEPSLDGPDRDLLWDREIVHTVGGFEATDWDAFGEVSSVGFDAAGNLYILDSQAFSVSVVSPEGEFLRSFGAQGEGPGELQRPQSLAVFPDGSVAIYDMSKFGFVTYDSNGEWIEDVTSSRTGAINLLGNLGPVGLGVAAGGEVLAERIGRVMISQGPSSADSDSEPEPEGDPVVRAPLRGTLEPTVVFRAWEPPEPTGPEEEVGGASGNGGTFQIRMAPLRAFTPQMHLAVLADGRFAVVDSTDYRVRIFQQDGTAVGEISRPIAPVAVTPQIEEREQAHRREVLQARMDEGDETGGTVVMLGGGGGRMAMPNMNEAQMNRIENMQFYPEIPVVAGLAADWEGRIWVQRSSSEPGERGPIDIVTVDGKYVGTLSPDGPETPTAFGPNGLAAWIETDEYDVASIVVARIVDRNATS